MNKHLQSLKDFLSTQEHFNTDTNEEVKLLVNKLDKELTILEFKLDRTEKVKRTTSVLLEETIEELEQKRKETIKQASLDRIRGQIASMRSTEDLQSITPIIWHELTVLGVPFIRCGVFIIDEHNQFVQVYLSAPDGHSLAAMSLPFETNDLTTNSVKSWREGTVYTEQWNKEEFVSWMQSLIDQGHIKDSNSYQGASQPPESLNLHFVPFTQGMFYVGNTEALSTDGLDLVKALAETFAIAYARYEDFKNLEDAKHSIESTLNELKSTQAQLIQSEKMASLGELTAGIAHEIQNPLNFVNNFSEVSNELIDEMNEELDNGDIAEAQAISTDLKQNLEKINQHGQRASSIVKGMLEHSRTSDGKKEPTDLNKLADEYLRLAYHGIRAKDKSFNADFTMDFDVSLPKINVIPQDIGRVLLNLINNAFYAVASRKASMKNKDTLKSIGPLTKEYAPMVIVSTKTLDGLVEIKVRDNGSGIPDEIKEKVFQPFFTTKPTGQGTGLGLSLVYDIIKAHGGTISLESTIGKGTEFIIQLPDV